MGIDVLAIYVLSFNWQVPSRWSMPSGSMERATLLLQGAQHVPPRCKRVEQGHSQGEVVKLHPRRWPRRQSCVYTWSCVEPCQDFLCRGLGPGLVPSCSEILRSWHPEVHRPRG